LLLFFVLTALFHTPLGFEWQHRYSLKLYPFALLALVVWITPARKPGWPAQTALSLIVGFSLVRQLLSFKQHTYTDNTANGVLSDVHLVTHALSDPCFGGLHVGVSLLLLFWAAIGLAWWWRRSPSWKSIARLALIIPGLVVTLVFLKQVVARGSGAGLEVTYYKGPDFQKAVATRIETAIFKDYGFARPAWRAPRNGYSARWLGTLVVPENTTYTFYAEGDDGFRMWLDGRVLLDNWSSREWRGSGRATNLFLQAGKHAICVEHCKNLGAGALRLRWQGGPIPWNSIVASPYLQQTPP
jgi:hypothetical protein